MTTPTTPKLPEPATGAMKVVAWRVSSDRSAVTSVTDNGARVAALKKYPHTVIEDLVLLSDALALVGEVERLRAAARNALGTLNSLTSDKSYGCLKERHREYAEHSIKKLRAALDASRARATQEAK